MAKKNDGSGLLLLAVISGLLYFLYRSGGLNTILNSLGLGTYPEFSNGGGGGGSFFNGNNNIPPQGNDTITPPPTPPPLPPTPLYVGLIPGQTAKLNTPQNYYFIGQNKNNEYIQKGAELLTTPAMKNPVVVQSRGIIAQTTSLDVGKLVRNIQIARTTPQVINPQELVKKTSGIDVGNLINILQTKRPLNVAPVVKPPILTVSNIVKVATTSPIPFIQKAWSVIHK